MNLFPFLLLFSTVTVVVVVASSQSPLLEPGSGDYDDDDEDHDVDDTEDDHDHSRVVEEEVEEDIVPTRSLLFSNIEPTPSFSPVLAPASSVSSSFTFTSSSPSSSVLQIQPSKSLMAPMMSSILAASPNNVYYGSGDGFEETPSTSQPPPPPQPHHRHRVTKPLQKQLLHSGSPHRLSVEDSNCSLTPVLSWQELIKESDTRTTVLSLPANDDISLWELTLRCEHYDYDLFYSVRQRQKSRNWNHLWRVEFAMQHRSLRYFVEEILTGLLMSPSVTKVESDLVVWKYDLSEYPFYVEWTNETVLSGEEVGSCPVASLTQIHTRLSRLVKSHGSLIKSLTLSPIPTNPLFCGKSALAKISGGSSSTPVSSSTTPSSVNNNIVPTTTVNYPPSIKNQIDTITAITGHYLEYKIPEDFCYDPEDGSTSRLKLELKRLEDFKPWGDGFWLQFDEKNGELWGVPMETDHRRSAVLEAVIVCNDSGGRSATDAFTLQILPPPKTSYSAEFQLHFTSIPFIPLNLRKFIKKLTTLLDGQIHVKSYSFSNGHVLFSYYNTSDPKRESELTEIRKVLYTDDAQVTKRAKELFAPEFNLTVSGGVIPVGGGLLGGAGPIDINTGMGNDKSRVFDFDERPHHHGNNKMSDEDIDGGGTGGGGGVDDNNNNKNNVVDDGTSWLVELQRGTYLTTYILPSVLICIMILLSLIIACLLSRKKAYYEEDFLQEEMKKNKKKHKVPVIFQEELEVTQQLNKGGGGSGGGGNNNMTGSLRDDHRMPLPPKYSERSGGGSLGRLVPGQGQPLMSQSLSSASGVGNIMRPPPPSGNPNLQHAPSMVKSYPDPYSNKYQPPVYPSHHQYSGGNPLMMNKGQGQLPPPAYRSPHHHHHHPQLQHGQNTSSYHVPP